MLSVPDVFSLYAELALTLAGFAGVTSAFSGRDRAFKPIERSRVQAVLMNSAAVLGGCLAFYGGLGAGLALDQSIRVSGLMSFLFTLPVSAIALPNAWRHLKDPDSTTETWVLSVATGINISLLILYGWTGLFGEGAALLLIAFPIQMMLALWMFTRLLTRHN
jgi:hypothetical protein